MSDFDEEAERERLREKYEQEEKEREATEQMSELLLKGATMTNAHCSDCGDPIFRYDGQEFCPTCEKPVDRGDGEAAEGDDASDENGESPGQVEVASPSDDARVRFGGEGEAEDQTEATAGEADESEPADDHGAEPGTAPPQGEPTRQPADSPRIEDEQPVEGGAPARQPADANATATSTGDVSSNVASARASLARTAARFASAAENTDDPAVAREHLAAAQAAAEALDELD